MDASEAKVIISVGTPVKDSNRFTAGMFYDLELTNLATLVNQVNLFDAGYLFLVTADGTTIAHPNAKNNGEMLSSYMPQASIREGSQEIEVDGKMFVNFTHPKWRLVHRCNPWWRNRLPNRWRFEKQLNNLLVDCGYSQHHCTDYSDSCVNASTWCA